MADLWVAATVARRSGLGHGPDVDAASEAETALDDVRERLAADRGVSALLQDGAGVVAIALAVPARADDGASTTVLPGVLHVSMVAVRPDRWGAGLAGAVLDVVLDRARSAGFTSSQLWTHDTNVRAQRLYERKGFSRSDRAKTDDRGEAVHLYRSGL